ncbi:MAG TPA: hypothetical protein VGL77_16995 [Armatimonadota bacterium]
MHACAPTSQLEIGTWTDTAFAEHGAVFCCATRALAQVQLRPCTGSRCRLHAAHTGELETFLHRAAGYFDLAGIEAHCLTETPCPETSSYLMAAHAVALTGALACLANRFLTPHQLASIAHRILCEEMGQPCGVQRFMAAALGGISLYDISPFPRTFPIPLDLPDEVLTQLEQRTLIISTGREVKHSLYQRVQERSRTGERGAREALWELRALPRQAADALRMRNLAALGGVMNEHARQQRQLCPEIDTPEVQYIRTVAQRHSALGSTVNSLGSHITVLCDDTTARISLSSALRAGGFSVTTFDLDHYGLRVWVHEPGEEPLAHPSAA